MNIHEQNKRLIIINTHLFFLRKALFLVLSRRYACIHKYRRTKFRTVTGNENKFISLVKKTKNRKRKMEHIELYGYVVLVLF